MRFNQLTAQRALRKTFPASGGFLCHKAFNNKINCLDALNKYERDIKLSPVAKNLRVIANFISLKHVQGEAIPKCKQTTVKVIRNSRGA
ncbi:unnamed protein product [Colias eurytheme]|nr:unnamed protein product [Colias eurytheme]